jgi:hypothetical protein
MIVVQLEAKSSRELGPSSRMPIMMSGIPQIPIIVSQEQQVRFVMPDTIVIVCKLRQELEPFTRQ